jgi:hypothetical protein
MRPTVTPISDPLYVIAVISNPCRYHSRYELFEEFQKYVRDSGAQLIVVEAAFGDRPHAITDRLNENHLQLRGSHEIWLKENLINAGLAHLCKIDPHWKRVAWVDADVKFSRQDWVQETIQQLQHFPIVQMFSRAHNLGPDHSVISDEAGFAFSYRNGLVEWDYDGGYRSPAEWHPGYAWAARREAIDALGGLLDIAILGSGDQLMARALIGRGRDFINPAMHPHYLAEVDRWQERAERHIRRNIGFVPTAVFHSWHGSKSRRGYLDRWKILRDLQYDPLHDIKRDSQGLYQLVDHGDVRSIELRDKLQAYFRSRNEDSIDP